MSRAFAGYRKRTGSGDFKQTHPFLTFDFDLRRAPATLWMCLGEIRSKCEHLGGVPLKPDTALALHNIYLARGAHATAAIEGNTLSEEQVLARMRGKAVVPDSQRYLQQEIDNVLEVTKGVMMDAWSRGRHEITPDEIRNYNELLLRDLAVEDHVQPGSYRKVRVGVMDYQAPLPEDCEDLVATFCDWLNSEAFEASTDDEVVVYGVIKAIVAHIYFAWIHPFGDGNGRTARVLEVRFLAEAGVPSPAVQLLSNHYNKTRSEYYRQLSAASKKLQGDITQFVQYAVHGMVDQLREQLSFVREQQWFIAWVNYIYEIYGSEKTIADKRQIQLILALSQYPDYLPMSKLRYLTPELAEMYAGKTPKTITRDLNDLAGFGLVERTKGGVRAKKEVILAFLPPRADAQREHAEDVVEAARDAISPEIADAAAEMMDFNTQKQPDLFAPFGPLQHHSVVQ